MPYTEPNVIINGNSLTEGQALTLRVALQNFISHISPINSLGTDKHGEFMRANYLDRAGEINEFMQKEAQAPATPATPQHILGMEPESVCRQMVRNYCAGGQPLTVEACILLMMEFNRWLVSTNETWQKLMLDKINTELPKPIVVAEAAPTMPIWLRELQDFAKELKHCANAGCYESDGQDGRDPDACQKCYLEQIIREIPGAGQGRKP